jgi:hemerythrin-like domain-containing protein
MTAVMSPGFGADEALDMTPLRSAGRTEGPFARLRAEHRRALDLLRKFERAIGDASQRQPEVPDERPESGERSTRDERPFQVMADYLAGPFSAHLAVEERVMFPALRAALPELAPVLGPLREDHAAIREMSESMGELLARPATPRRDEQLLVLGRDLTDLIRLHVRKEERTVMDWSERVVTATVLLELGQRIADGLAPSDPRRRP